MYTRTEEEMMELIIGFAESDRRIRAVLLNGSRVNQNVGKDPFQDYDVQNIVTDIEPFKKFEYVIPHFGETIVVEQPLIGPWPPDDADGSYYNYNIQLLDGNRVDLSFYHVNRLKERLTDSLTKVLIDKDNRILPLSPPDESSYYITKPSQELYSGCCTGFFFTLGSHIPKTIWRKKLPLLKFYIESCLRQSILMMLKWEIGIKTGWEKSIGNNGKDLEKYLIPEMWNDYKNTYVGFNYTDLWDSLFLFHDIFRKSALFVGESFGYQFPQNTADKVNDLLKHVETLPQDAKSIYL